MSTPFGNDQLRTVSVAANYNPSAAPLRGDGEGVWTQAHHRGARAAGGDDPQVARRASKYQINLAAAEKKERIPAQARYSSIGTQPARLAIAGAVRWADTRSGFRASATAPYASPRLSITHFRNSLLLPIYCQLCWGMTRFKDATGMEDVVVSYVLRRRGCPS